MGAPLVTTAARTPDTRPSRRHRPTPLVLGLLVCAVLFAVGLVVALRSPAYRAGGSVPPVTTPTQPVVVPGFRFVPLWPFQGVGDATTWQHSYRASGVQPWHLDASQSAVRFAHDFLGYTEIDRVVGTVVRTASEAWVPVGSAPVEGQLRTAAVLHLAQIGAGPDAPWEVVGSRDSTLTLITPSYGSSVIAPITVSGRISGVDENLQVQVRTAAGVVGSAENIPAGGMRSLWSATVDVVAPSGSALTVAVSTGGHLAAVERFAITGLYVT
jgi:hypothetical protein